MQIQLYLPNAHQFAPINTMDQQKVVGGCYNFTVSLIFCVHFFVAKEVLQTISPLMLGAARGILGGLILYTLFFSQLKNQLNAKNIGTLFSIAFFGYFSNQLLVLNGLKLSTPLNTIIILNTSPLVMAMMAMLLKVEYFAWRKLAGCLLGFSLVAAFMIFTSPVEFVLAKPGNLFIFASVIAVCISTIQIKTLLKKGFPCPMISASMLFLGGLGLLFFATDEVQTLITYTLATQMNFAKMTFEIVIASSLIYLLSLRSLKYLSPSQAMIFMYLQPMMAAGIDYVVYHKLPSLLLVPLFCGVLLAGYWVISADTH